MQHLVNSYMYYNIYIYPPTKFSPQSFRRATPTYTLLSILWNFSLWNALFLLIRDSFYVPPQQFPTVWYISSSDVWVVQGCTCVSYTVWRMHTWVQFINGHNNCYVITLYTTFFRQSFFLYYSPCPYLEGIKDALCHKFKRLTIGAQTRVAKEMHSRTNGAKRHTFERPA